MTGYFAPFMDWSAITIQAIVILPVLLLNALTLIQGIRTHRTFNSKMDAMLELTRKAAFAAGEKAEADKSKRRPL